MNHKEQEISEIREARSENYSDMSKGSKMSTSGTRNAIICPILSGIFDGQFT